MTEKKQVKTQATSGSAIRRELLQSNHLPFVSWSEKYPVPDSKQKELSWAQQLEIKLSILQQCLMANTSEQ